MQANKPRLSLIICTRNRAELLTRCLESLLVCQIPEESCEIVLVNNGSSDHSDQVMFSFQRESQIPVRVLDESRIGLSHARNLGIKYAQGEIIAFTDDDCIASKDYLVTLCRISENSNWGYFGGKISNYDPKKAESVQTHVEHLTEVAPGAYIRPGFISGANMAFRKKVIDALGSFDTCLGSGVLCAGEDIDYCQRASLAGFKGVFSPELLIYHYNPLRRGERLKEVVKGYSYGCGAYQIKFLMQGRLRYFSKGFEIFKDYLHYKQPERIWYQFAGAFSYLWLRFRKAVAL